MKLTLLDMVQSILSAMGSDEVNSYSDTAESRQVAEIVRRVYFNIINRAQLPEHNDLFSLDPSGDITMPVLMYKPSNVGRIDWIKYDKNDLGVVAEPAYADVFVIPLPQFLSMTHMLNIDETYVDSMVLDQQTYYFRNDIQPTYCTIVKDHYIIFDSYNTLVDATIQESKTQCFGQLIPVFTLDDSFTPSMDDQQFPLFLNECISLAFAELKQMTNEKVEQESRRQWVRLQSGKHLTKPNYFDDLPDYGRRRK